MQKTQLKLTFILFILLLSTSSQAAVYDLTATLDGGQEVPPTASAGTGTMTGTLNDVTNVFSWNIAFGGLTGTETAAHYHLAPAGVNGGVIIALPTGTPKVDSQVVTPAQTADLIAGNIYINIHSTVNPGGEIRGQVNAVLAKTTPIPAVNEWGVIMLSLLLLISGTVIMRMRQG